MFEYLFPKGARGLETSRKHVPSSAALRTSHRSLPWPSRKGEPRARQQQDLQTAGTGGPPWYLLSVGSWALWVQHLPNPLLCSSASGPAPSTPHLLSPWPVKRGMTSPCEAQQGAKCGRAVLVCSPNQLCTSGFHCFLLLRCPRLSAAPRVPLMSASNWSGKTKAAVNFTVCLHFNKFYRGTVIHGVLQQQYGSLPVQFSEVRACSWVAPGETCAVPIRGCEEPPAAATVPTPSGCHTGPQGTALAPLCADWLRKLGCEEQ